MQKGKRLGRVVGGPCETNLAVTLEFPILQSDKPARSCLPTPSNWAFLNLDGQLARST